MIGVGGAVVACRGRGYRGAVGGQFFRGAQGGWGRGDKCAVQC